MALRVKKMRCKVSFLVVIGDLLIEMTGNADI